jgi:hypothetical protein
VTGSPRLTYAPSAGDRNFSWTSPRDARRPQVLGQASVGLATSSPPTTPSHATDCLIVRWPGGP